MLIDDKITINIYIFCWHCTWNIIPSWKSISFFSWLLPWRYRLSKIIRFNITCLNSVYIISQIINLSIIIQIYDITFRISWYRNCLNVTSWCNKSRILFFCSCKSTTYISCEIIFCFMQSITSTNIHLIMINCHCPNIRLKMCNYIQNLIYNNIQLIFSSCCSFW